MIARPFVNFASPANQQVLAFLNIAEPDKAILNTPGEINYFGLGAHPDLVEYFWGLLKPVHPECACVINERSFPLLAHPVSGIIFGLAGGTSTLAFRLPEPERSEMLKVPGYGAEYKYPKSTVTASSMGTDWVLLNPYAKANADMAQKAFDYAGTVA